MPQDEPQGDAAPETPRLTVSAQWYLWEGGFLAFGKGDGIVPPHSHHAIQIVIAINGEVAIKGARGEWRNSRGVIVRQDAEHSFKLTRAMLAIAREPTIAAAAHAADFADAAHLTRTFYQMFGIPPSVMMRGDFFEIASPFSTAR